MTWATEVAADNPVEHWRFVSNGANEIGGGAFLSAADKADEILATSPNYGATALIPGESNACLLGDSALSTNGAGFWVTPPTWFNTATAFSLELVFKVAGIQSAAEGCVWRLHYKNGSANGSYLQQDRGCGIEVEAANKIVFWAADPTGGFKTVEFSDAAVIAADTVLHVVAAWDGTNIELFVNGSSVGATACTAIGRVYDTGGNGFPLWAMYLNGANNLDYSGFSQNSRFSALTVDDALMYDAALPAARVAAHHAESGAPAFTPSVTYTPSLPVAWDIKDSYAPSVRVVWNLRDTYTPSLPVAWDIKDTFAPSLPVRWEIPQTSAPSLPVRWSIVDDALMAGDYAAWELSVSVGGVDISEKLVGVTRVEVEENVSSIASVAFAPDAGGIDPATWENERLLIDFVGLQGGVVHYVKRRFTGKVSRAVYEPETAVMSITGTNDLQGRLEAMERTQIDAAIYAAYWSEHVFDDTADGWQYALDRLSTRPAYMHIDHTGRLVVGDWAAGAPAVTFVDDTRFGSTLAVTRTDRRDLLNKVRLYLDFEFTRLRQREIGVRIAYTGTVCEYLLRPFNALQRSQVAAVADAGQWQRQGEIAYDPFFAADTYLCQNPPAPFFPVIFAAAGIDFSSICLGASWKSARRWAQTVVETTVIDVTASDSIAAVGEFGLSEDYGLEAEYDATGWETQRFDGTRSGAVVNSAGDHVFDADQVTANDRAAYELAQQCAIAKARTEILSRHRGNRVAFNPVYWPDMALDLTVRINSTYLQATGKVRAYVEEFDHAGGDPDLTVELAVSRHGGSGLAVDDPVEAIAQPAAPDEPLPVKQLQVGYHIGGDPTSPPQQDDWQGFITNRTAPEDASTLYADDLFIEFPEIEDSARDAVTLTAQQTVDVAVPLDELTMSA